MLKQNSKDVIRAFINAHEGDVLKDVFSLVDEKEVRIIFPVTYIEKKYNYPKNTIVNYRARILVVDNLTFVEVIGDWKVATN